jgi:hypothetical protein
MTINMAPSLQMEEHSVSLLKRKEMRVDILSVSMLLGRLDKFGSRLLMNTNGYRLLMTCPRSIGFLYIKQDSFDEIDIHNIVSFFG